MGGVMWTGYAGPEWAWLKGHFSTRFVIPGLTRFLPVGIQAGGGIQRFQLFLDPGFRRSEGIY